MVQTGMGTWELFGCTDPIRYCDLHVLLRSEQVIEGQPTTIKLFLGGINTPVDSTYRIPEGEYPFDDITPSDFYITFDIGTAAPYSGAPGGVLTISKNRGDTLAASFIAPLIRTSDQKPVRIEGFFRLIHKQTNVPFSHPR